MDTKYQLTPQERNEIRRTVCEWDRLYEAIRTYAPPPPLLTDKEWAELDSYRNVPGYAEAMQR